MTDNEKILAKLDAIAATVVELASRISRRDNVIECRFCGERVMRTSVCPFCLKAPEDDLKWTRGRSGVER